MRLVFAKRFPRDAHVRQQHPMTAHERFLRAALIGVVAGFLSGMFGVGGGILIVPGLLMLLPLDQRYAHGTSLAATAPIALSGLIGFALEDSVDWTVAAFLTMGSVVGAFLGTRALSTVPQRSLRLGFAALLVVTAGRMFVSIPDAGGRGGLTAVLVIGLVGIGVFAGTIAGLLGVGGGIVTVPAMALLLSIPQAAAKGTSLAVIVPTAIVGTMRNLKKGNADLAVAGVTGGAGVASAFIGSKISVDLDPEVSSVLFGLLLTAVAVRLLVGKRRTAPTPAAPGPRDSRLSTAHIDRRM